MTARLRVLSANLARDGGADPAAFASLVREFDPQVVAVQELGRAQAIALATVLPFGRLEPGRRGGRLGIARRSPGPVIRIPLNARDAYSTEVRLLRRDGRHELVEILNVHILAPQRFPPWRRWAQLSALEAYLDAAPERPRVLIGDLNATPLWPVYRRLTRQLRDAARELCRGSRRRPACTWGPWPGSPRLLRIDHALVGRLAVDALRVIPVKGSDHSALLVDLSLPDV